MRCLAVSLLMTSLIGPALAADAIKGNRQETFGEVTVHYNTFNSTALQPDIARNVEVLRSKQQGVISLSIIRNGKPQVAQVSGTIKTLTTDPVALSFKQIHEYGAVSYIAQYPVPQQEIRIFEIIVQTGGDTHRFSFNQELFPGQ
ncbi:DUF4426 domain-containing protein [Pseudomonas sp. CDFA 602]|uniref:DUF4426 domain-containing protein n=1 Tax=Pseudomonas californiensis TaxID=2829823 RepID=UPI001E4D2FC9|nr:DUF4426 domain-containing protein [Pseudomonas californiensis]MCD5992350.1 DUF4426 domain-containing protein [Pseudomonas californiensis]MCD5997958.1 DUF4426 domain-containing protein [Pseudomonas californiensis]